MSEPGPLSVIQGDNLNTLRNLKEQGAKFDLIELDGPYMAHLEDWDNLTEDEYIQHYADRLTLVRDVLQPWGVVFVFGYPEGCAEIKSWAHRSGTLYLRRWLTWYKQVTAHKGRKVENILFFLRDEPEKKALLEFGVYLKSERVSRGWKLTDIGRMTGKPWWDRGGNLYFETGSGDYPSIDDFITLSRLFGFDPGKFPHVLFGSYPDLTDIDYLSKNYPEKTDDLNDNGLRSKPVGLYLDLFKPTMPPTDNKRALVLYGGSGNAAIAAGALGYDVTLCELDGARCKAIRERYEKVAHKWLVKVEAQEAQMNLLPDAKQQPQLFQGV